MAVLAKVPGKLRSCLEERDAMRQRADEALRAKEEVGSYLMEESGHTGLCLAEAESWAETVCRDDSWKLPLV